MPDLTAEDVAILADRLIDIRWAVYLQGADRLVYCPCLCLVQPCAQAFDNQGAHEFALTAGRTASVFDAAGMVDEVTVTAYVMHHGIVWARR